jgi:malate dehydrogenase (oxaloacetate-decarboxylating)
MFIVKGKIMDIKKKSLEKHFEWNGKIEVISRASIKNKEELSLAYTPGVAEACLAIKENPALSYKLTRRNNLVAVITDGTAVLGLGDIGPEASMPVMEGKCALLKEFAGVDAIPICVNSKDTDELVRTIYLISKSFGGINLEDISAPRCFEIEERLNQICDIPVFHDDQHGTAIVASAALINAFKFTGRKIGESKIVINGAGAAGIAIAKQLLAINFGNVILCDINGAIYEGAEGLNSAQEFMSKITNKNKEKGNLKDIIKSADVFIGVSRPNLVDEDMIKSMAKDPIVFPMANPVPEIMPELALKAGAKVVGSGRSDFKNQINNVLAFPGIFKGLLESSAKNVTEKMKISAAFAIANIIKDEEISADYIIPDPFDKRVVEAVSKAVIDEAKREKNTSYHNL